LYEDVEEALKLWTSSGKQVYIYSSGSVEAQKLLFEHSVAGNLLQVYHRATASLNKIFTNLQMFFSSISPVTLIPKSD
jgi:methionine salvage enolase-phosphatase E1